MSNQCGDVSTNLQNSTIEDYKHDYKLMSEISPTFTPFRAYMRASCRDWKIRSAEHHSIEAGIQLSFPLLSTGNDYDPATPGKFAEDIARQFPGSVYLRRHGYGHSSASMPSDCVHSIVREYFLLGFLPPLGTECKPNFDAFASAQYNF